MIQGAHALSPNAKGKMMALFRNEPRVMAQSTGSSRAEEKPTAFSALTAKSSPKMPAVFLPATLVMAATSSINRAMSSKSAKNPLGMAPSYNSLMSNTLPNLKP